MNIQKFTQKSVEAINDCEKLAYEYGNQEIEQEHLMVALMQQEDGLIPKLIEKMEIQKQHFADNARRKLEARVKAVSYTHLDVYKRQVLKIVKIILKIYVEVFRGTPMIVQAVFIYYGAAQIFNIQMGCLLYTSRCV